MPPASQQAPLALGAHGGEATLRFPFQLAADGGVYAKLLPSDGNPAVANGTVAADRTAGLTGWWAHLVLEPSSGSPVDLGYYADAGATPLVQLPGGARHTLILTVHAPVDAGDVGQVFRVDLALAHRDATTTTVDPSWGFTSQLVVSQTATVPAKLDLGLAWPLLGAAAGVAALAAVLAARRQRRSKDWL
ncbi:MAG: hypothetical protein LC624_06105 [Halobacteriales archaeon]|nr:hypothetical protein [Halobacteriales archaeon]